MSCTDCIVCGGRRYLDERGIPFCENCRPIMAEHVVSMRTDDGCAVAVCPCGWSTRLPWTQQGRWAREAAVIEHWQSIRRADGGANIVMQHRDIRS